MPEKEEIKYGWHVINSSRLLMDRREVKDSVWYSAFYLFTNADPLPPRKWKINKEYPINVCSHGMHACCSLSAAWGYKNCSGPGCQNERVYSKKWIVCRVAVKGDVTTDCDKFCGRKRKILWSIIVSEHTVDRKVNTGTLRSYIQRLYRKKYKKDLPTHDLPIK